jgi:hypothetical protein
VREQRGLRGIDDLALEHVERHPASFEVTFRAEAEQHRVTVDEERGDLTLMTCSSESLERPRRYVVRSA